MREYQHHWLSTYQTKAGVSSSMCADAVPTEDGYSLPIDRVLIDADPDMLDASHHDYPAIDLILSEGSPIYAVRGGTVARVVDWRHNCSRVERCVQTCGVGLAINGDDGARYIYCHGTHLNGISVGDHIAVGQLLLWSGNTGRSGAPHLHLEIRVDGRQRCPQPMLGSLFDSGRSVAPAALPAGGCSS